MARELIFSINGVNYPTSPTKIDRKKLYGYEETIAIDDEGNECRLVSMDDTGTLIIPKGGIAQAILSADGKWIKRNDLKTIYLDGTDAELIPSSFSNPINLTNKVSMEFFLDHNILNFQQLDGASDQLIDYIGSDIYLFPYLFRDGYEPSNAFIMVSDIVDKVKRLFLFIGQPNDFKYYAFTEMGIVDQLDDIDEEESDELDFGMF